MDAPPDGWSDPDLSALLLSRSALLFHRTGASDSGEGGAVRHAFYGLVGDADPDRHRWPEIRSRILVRGSVELATHWGVSERIISLTVVSIGTSLPELSASLISALRGQRDMALGNVLGSNIFNIGSVIGFSSIITPIEPSSGHLLSFDFPYMIAMTLSILILMALARIFFQFMEGVLFLPGTFYTCL